MKTSRSIIHQIAAWPNLLWQGHKLPRLLVAGAAAVAVGLAGPLWAANIAPLGTGTLGFNDAIDTDPGTPYYQAGVLANINDDNVYTRVDDWSNGSDGGQNVSFVGVLWPTLRYDQITTLTLTLATFWDGGWFGVSANGPGSGGTLIASDLIEPTVQVSTDGGSSWTTVNHTSTYLTALDGHVIGDTAGVNPTTVTAVFTLDSPATQVNGIRIIGENGGTADGNGFIGVFELTVEGAPPADSDGDSMPDVWEQLYGLTVGTNDAAGDLDGDGLTNLQEFTTGTRPNLADTDGDGLADGAEVTTHLTNPVVADTDGDGLSDGAEVNTHHTNPTLVDTDSDGLSDGAEVNTHLTNPLARDSDADTFSDGLEVAQGTDPRNAASYPSNASLTGAAILGVNDAIDTDAGTSHFNAGVLASINDGNPTTRVDNWFGGDAQTFSFVGVVWPAPLPSYAKSLTLTLATFFDGGWFGYTGNGPGIGEVLSGYLVEPSIQVSVDGGTNWTDVAHTSDYLTALDAHAVPSVMYGAPTTATSTFTLTTPITGITGIRIIGENGGLGGDANGFLGVFELEVTAGLVNDVDSDGMDDGWETSHRLSVGINDAIGDPDTDGLSNIQEFAANTNPQAADTDADGLGDGAEVRTHNTNPVLADTDGDGLNDGQEVNTTATDPLVADSDGDGLSDGQEVNVHHCDPNKVDTDGDGFDDAMEVASGTDPNSAASAPANVALLGNGILGVNDAIDTDSGTPYFQAGVLANINDGNPLTSVDTWNNTGVETVSYVGILWDQPLTRAVTNLTLTLATFYDGGWFGVNGVDPGAGGLLSASDLVEPSIQVSTNAGTTWATVAHTSDYLTKLDGHGIGGGANPNPSSVTSAFTLTEPATGIDGIRIIGNEGGTASGGFLGVFELAVHAGPSAVAQPVTLLNAMIVGGTQFRFEFDSQPGVTYNVSYKTSLADIAWQPHSTITGDGTRKTATDNGISGTQRFYRVTSQ